MISRPRYFGLIAAAGAGTRLGRQTPKQYLALAGRPMLRHAIDRLAVGTPLHKTYVVLAQDDRSYAGAVGSIDRVVPLYCGGDTRARSVSNGLELMRGEAHERDWVLVHDAARPCLERSALTRLLLEVGDDAVGGLLAVPVADTLKRGTGEQRSSGTVSRDDLWQAQTPQMFRYGLLLEALRAPSARGCTDEAQAVEALGFKPRLVTGSKRNIKVTFVEDLAVAEALIATDPEGGA